MIKEAFGTGATIEAALNAAKQALNAPEGADVKCEIVEQPKKKVLGLFGGSLAKARASYVAAEPAAPVARSAEKAAKPQTNRNDAAKPAPAKQGSAPAAKKPAAPAPKSAPKADKPKSTAKPETPAKKEQPAAAPAKADKASAAEKAAADVQLDPVAIQGAVDYLLSIIRAMGLNDVSASYTLQGGCDVMVDLDCGDHYGAVIGRRGETLDSLQYLTRLVANKLSKEYVRISINVGDYREKREQSLSELAARRAEKVLKYGRNFVFEPMNPYERRIIHTAVQGIEGVSSHSVGTDAERRVVITLAPGVEPTGGPAPRTDRNDRRPGQGGRNGRPGGRGGRPGGYNNRDRGSAPQAPTREPRTDDGAQKTSLYGKIN